MCTCHKWNERGNVHTSPQNPVFKDEYADRIEHIRAGSKAENLQNRSLLLDEHGFYASFKILFTQFMIEIAPHLQIKRSYYTWTGFGELVEDSYEWLKNMKTAVEKLMNTRGCHEERAKDYLSKYLVKFDLNARNHEYIKLTGCLSQRL